MTTRIRPTRQIEIMTSRTVQLVDVPASSSSPGVPGDLAWDASYLYLCIALDTWVRSPLETW